MTSALIQKSEFIGLDGVAHLAAGGESPMLVTHGKAIEQFIQDKARGEFARQLQSDVVERTRNKCSQLFGVDASDITFLSNASEGINNIAYGLDWREGDNVVVVDVEFPSGILPWTKLESRGVELRIVRNRNWSIQLDDIAAQIDDRTRVVEISHVSMLTGQRINLPEVSALVRSSNALLLLDATHAAGVVPVDASLADVMVSSCYKWLLGVQGVAVFYVNRQRFPSIQPPFVGWNSYARHGGWQSPVEYELQDTAHCFQPGNASFIGIYILENALDRILNIGVDNIERHALSLSGQTHDAVAELGYQMMTPREDSQRAGNVCFLADDLETLRLHLEKQQVLIWGAYAGYGRLRISTHAYNDSSDTDRCIKVLQEFSL